MYVIEDMGRYGACEVNMNRILGSDIATKPSIVTRL